jgi:hypothetical protein
MLSEVQNLTLSVFQNLTFDLHIHYFASLSFLLINHEF